MSETAGSKVRLLELDALRGMAALGVVLCHYTSLCQELAVIPFSFHYGSYGPHLFFMISGFVIFMTLGVANRRLILCFPGSRGCFPCIGWP